MTSMIETIATGKSDSARPPTRAKRVHRIACYTAAAAIALAGCSTKPREFTPTLNPPAADETAYEHDLQTCKTLVGNGHKSNFKHAAISTGSGLAAGVGTAAIVVPAAVNIAPMAAGGATAAASFAIPIVGIGVGIGVSRWIRSTRERKVKTALGSCLAEYGYTVERWTVLKRPKKQKEPAAVATLTKGR